MKRHPALIELSRDHHRGLLLAQLMKTDAPPYRDLPTTDDKKCKYFKQKFREELLPHFKEEEDILFPFIVGKHEELKTICDQLIDEHKRIIELEDALTPDAPDKAIMHEAGILLESHIRTEERILFMKTQEMLTEAELESLEKLLKRED